MVPRCTGSAAASLGLYLAVSCASSTGDEFGLSSAIVYGRVTRAGVAVAGAEVRVWPFIKDCPSNFAVFSYVPVVTNLTGEFRKLLVQPLSDRTDLCIVVQALSPPPPNTLDSAVVQGTHVRTVLNERGPPDSVRIDLTIP